MLIKLEALYYLYFPIALQPYEVATLVSPAFSELYGEKCMYTGSVSGSELAI